ncbi:MAG: GGDEF domain-containing protein [Candidatus Latescibacteria bacterium]|nr:GGDEF domain-containing protein [Candidatus Latescibacterota bacterium]
MEKSNEQELIEKLQAELNQLREENQKLKASNRRWMRLAGIEDLTGLPNRIFFITVLLPQHLGLAYNDKQSFSCIIVAPDGLGEINKRYGRKGGDQIIREVADFLKEHLDPDEKLVHSDGSNFIVIIPGAEGGHAKRRGLLWRTRIAQRRFNCLNDQVGLTLSMGTVSVVPPLRKQLSAKEAVESILTRLESALDRAKQQGGDRNVEDLNTDFPDPGQRR